MKDKKKKKFVTAFSVGFIVATLILLPYQWYKSRVYNDITKEIHFLIRENDAKSAEAALERNMPFYEKARSMSLWNLLQFRLDLWKEGRNQTC